MIMEFKTESGKYYIRSWNITDSGSIVKYANNRKIWLNLRDAFPHPYTLEDAMDFISRASGEENSSFFAIATEKEAIGGIGLLKGHDVHRYSAEMGYWLAEPFWGKGIVTEAVKKVAEYGFKDLSLKRIYAEPYFTNSASAKVLEKAGFKLEGVLRSGAYKDGKFVDQCVYSLISEDFRKPFQK